MTSSLVEDLGLEPFDTASFKLDTLVGDKNTWTNLVKFSIQSTDTEELFGDVIAAVIPPWIVDVETLSGNLVKSCRCVPIGEKFCFAGISSKIWAFQCYWFSANQRQYAWRGNQRVET